MSIGEHGSEAQDFPLYLCGVDLTTIAAMAYVNLVMLFLMREYFLFVSVFVGWMGTFDSRVGNDSSRQHMGNSSSRRFGSVGNA